LRVRIVEDRIEQELFIAAPPEVVSASSPFPPSTHAGWVTGPPLDPRPGGVYHCEVNDTHTVVGEYMTVEPPTTVVFTWGFAGHEEGWYGYLGQLAAVIGQLDNRS
jgi:uncharacterized protein YndB with AHSA1/START domain